MRSYLPASSVATPDLSRVPLSFDLRAVSVEEGVRAGLSIAVLVAADYVFHAPILLEAGLGALLTCLCDAGGLLRRRVPALLSFALLGGALIAGFGLARPIGYPLIPIACLGIFAFSLVRVYGQAAQQVGNLLSVVLVLSLDRSFATLHQSAAFAGVFVGGALWALLLTMVIWRLHPNRPARQAVARVYLALAGLAQDLGALVAAGADAAEWDRHARHHRRAVREAIEQARGVIGERLRTGGTAARPAVQSLLRLQSADALFAALITLTELAQSETQTSIAPHITALSGAIAAVLGRFAPQIVADTDDARAAMEAGIAAFAEVMQAMPAESQVRRIAELAGEQLRATLTGAGPASEWSDTPAVVGRVDRWLATLRANLDWRSAGLRHAARAALVAAVGLGITFTWPTSYQHWLTITLILTLQPYYALTLQRALERIGGTVLGGLLAAVLSLVCRTPLAIAAAIFPLSVLALSLRSVNFGLYVAALTPVIVLLVELAAPTHGHLTVVVMRAAYTLIGGGLAVIGATFLWPSWETDRLECELRSAIRRHGDYARLALWGREDGAATRSALDAARRAAGMASNNLEASLSRALLEPHRRGRHRLEDAVVVDAALRRVAARVLSLQVNAKLRPDPALARWRDWLGMVSEGLAGDTPFALPARPTALPNETVLAEGVQRLAAQFELIADALKVAPQSKTG